MEPNEERSFTFEGKGRGRQNNSQEIKINQLVVRLEGWQGKLHNQHTHNRLKLHPKFDVQQILAKQGPYSKFVVEANTKAL